MSNIDIALRLAEHFRQENEQLKRNLQDAYSVRLEPKPRVAVMFAGWKVERIGSTDSIRTTSPEGNVRTWNHECELFDLLAAIADSTP